MPKAEERPSEALLLIGLNAAFAENRWWALCPLFFWSIVLAFHFFLIRSHGPDDDWGHARAMREQARSNEDLDDKKVDGDRA
jgi:hypothetical protein